MESRQIEFSQDQQPEIAMFLTERINEFNAATTGFEGEEFACVVRDDGGRIIAGANGNTWGGWCFVANLWVHESARHQGAAVDRL